MATSNANKDTIKKEKKGKPGTDANAKSKTSMKDLYMGEVKKESNVSEATEVKREKGTRTNNAYKILIRPLVTEKVSVIGALNKYGFEVALKANKIEIAKAIKEVYGINPTMVNVIKVKGKEVRYGKRSGKRKDKKKAIITLPKGKSINLYEGV